VSLELGVLNDHRGVVGAFEVLDSQSLDVRTFDRLPRMSVKKSQHDHRGRRKGCADNIFLRLLVKWRGDDGWRRLPHPRGIGLALVLLCCHCPPLWFFTLVNSLWNVLWFFDGHVWITQTHIGRVPLRYVVAIHGVFFEFFTFSPVAFALVDLSQASNKLFAWTSGYLQALNSLKLRDASCRERSPQPVNRAWINAEIAQSLLDAAYGVCGSKFRNLDWKLAPRQTQADDRFSALWERHFRNTVAIGLRFGLRFASENKLVLDPADRSVLQI
jgi:hypothetical protein